MDYLVDCVDPRGIRITLTLFYFDKHIRKRHSEVSHHEIERVLSSPDVITVKPEDRTRHLYYKKGYWGPDRRHCLMQVVIGIWEEPAQVVTAFPFAYIDKKEEVIWPTS